MIVKLCFDGVCCVAVIPDGNLIARVYETQYQSVFMWRLSADQ